MTHHEITFSRAVSMTTAAIAAGQLSYADHAEIRSSILLIYESLNQTELMIVGRLSAYPISRNTLAEEYEPVSKGTKATQSSIWRNANSIDVNKLIGLVSLFYLWIREL